MFTIFSVRKLERLCRHTYNLPGQHPILTIGDPTSIIPAFLI